jgi:hypothetical protein
LTSIRNPRGSPGRTGTSGHPVQHQDGIRLWAYCGFANFLEQIELEVDRGQGFALLAIDSTPGYTDNQPFPAAPVKWTYRAIYRLGDNRVGQWSKPVSVTVGG